MRKAVDRWEIGNEVDSANYFKGTLKQYVSNFLKPASDELHVAGEKVVSAGVSWNPEDVKEMIGYGMLDMVDYVGFHPYARGVKLRGYLVWSFMDNFEWSYGFSKRFGIVRVDYDTQERMVKDSGRWFSELIQTRRIPA